MPTWRTVQWGVVAVVLVTTAVAGVAPGATGPTNPTLDEGTADVTVRSTPAEELRIDRGRFGTDVFYLRVPDVQVDVSRLKGTPRIVYAVKVPALDASWSTTPLVTDTGVVTVRGKDYGLRPGWITEDAYAATVSVRVQSFAVDDVVYDRNVTVEVAS